MSIYTEKAREFGELILSSEESIHLADARAIYQQTPEAVKKMEEYSKYQNDMKESMNKGEITPEEVKEASEKLKNMAIELKQDPAIGAWLYAESEFNEFVNTCMNVVKNTIMGKPEHECGCGDSCAGSCSGCN